MNPGALTSVQASANRRIGRAVDAAAAAFDTFTPAQIERGGEAMGVACLSDGAPVVHTRAELALDAGERGIERLPRARQRDRTR